MNVNNVGVKGEDYAVKLLQNKGYVVDKRNYRSRYGEIDIIAHDAEYLLFVEVKSRSGNETSPRSAVTLSKQAKIIKTALMYLQENNTNLQPRFDVIEVYFSKTQSPSLPRLCHLKNAFEAGDYLL